MLPSRNGPVGWSGDICGRRPALWTADHPSPQPALASSSTREVPGDEEAS